MYKEHITTSFDTWVRHIKVSKFVTLEENPLQNIVFPQFLAKYCYMYLTYPTGMLGNKTITATFSRKFDTLESIEEFVMINHGIIPYIINVVNVIDLPETTTAYVMRYAQFKPRNKKQ